MSAEGEAAEVLGLARELARLNGGEYDFLRERKQQEYRTIARHVIGSDWLAAALAAAAGTTREAEAWEQGYDARGRDIANEGLTYTTLTQNPYRSEATDD